ncbi:M15 family metallopeptidase [Campylobacter geochelonis]|uniref:NLP/P60 n=1 Tax=Campylobacter geochelonis TaxID=1780362 RepID=A0A128EI33_9BACT|nr:M15 family metallopeptidase [Campylobacter geochelonis]QKF71515.1 putative D-alanyl-D-alanine carboxypeptidase, NlpC/P60 family lipoprotein (SH3b1, SH3b2 type SH3 domains) [Campylobacter geochelonis]CZE48466.1 NLP/P60 [Campylobacter geochelonis]
MSKFLLLPLIALFFISCSTRQQDADLDSSQYPNHLSLLNLDLKQDVNILPAITNPLKFDKNVFLKRYFKVWSNTKPDTPKKDAFWGLETYKNNKFRTYYSPSRRAYGDDFFNKVKENANENAFGALSLPAITVKNTFLRNIPTHEPIFYDLKLNPSEGYPFDYLSNSTLGINYPLFVSHLSKDGDFAFVQNDAVWGWVDTRDVKFISKEQTNMFKNSNFITILKDRTPIKDSHGNFLFYGRVGTILMFERSDKDNFYGKVFTQKGLKNYHISKENATIWPAVLSDKNIKKSIASILGEPYGWGGFSYYRDCSLFTKDIMASFGIWLPRNSKAQANVYKSINLAGLSNDEKLEIIKKDGTPYLSVLYMPGHVMLYTGVVDGKVTITHNAWGIGTKSGGRALIGQTAITTLEIGKDRKDISNDKLLLSRLTSMSILPEDKNQSNEANLVLQAQSGLKDSKALINQNKFENDSASKTLEPSQQKRTASEILKQSYGVNLVDNRVFFKDKTSLEFDDKVKKSQKELLENGDIEDMINGTYPAFSQILAPKNDIGRVRNYEFLGKIYGSSEEEVKANLVDVVWLKNSLNLKLKFNSKNGAAAALSKVSDELDELVSKDLSNLAFLQDIGGTFKWRKIAKTNRPSAHSYGIAIDINAAKSNYWQWDKKFKFTNQIPLAIVKIFEKHGFIWGGRWKHYDTMHFEYRPEFFVN